MCVRSETPEQRVGICRSSHRLDECGTRGLEPEGLPSEVRHGCWSWRTRHECWLTGIHIRRPRLTTSGTKTPGQICVPTNTADRGVSLPSTERKCFKPKTKGWSVGSKTWVQSSWRSVWTQGRRHGTVKTMIVV